MSLRRLDYQPSLQTNTDFIEHHGILGQRWGVRRFQNKDGSLKPAGKKRYDSGEEGEERDKGLGPGAQKKSNGNNALKAAGIVGAGVIAGSSIMAAKNALGKSTPSAKNMTDKELLEANKRAALERTYNKNNDIKTSPADVANMASEGLAGAQKYLKAGKEPDNPNANRYNTRQTMSQKEMDRMSDKELQQLVNRLNLETQYSRLTADPPERDKVEVGLEKATAALTVIGATVGIGASLVTIRNSMKK